MTQRNRRRGTLRAATGVGLVTALMIPQLLVGAQEVSDGTPFSVPVSDSVTFEADLQPEEKPVELEGQYAWTSINGSIVESSYSTEPQSMTTSGDACVFGGAGPGCSTLDGVAGAATGNGGMDPIEQNRSLLIIGLVSVAAEVSSPITTAAHCSLDASGAPTGDGTAPGGVISYSGSGLLGSVDSKSVNFSGLASGETFVDRLDPGVLLNLLLPLHLDVRVSTEYGWDPVALRAYSEVTAHYEITDNTSVSDSGTYTARSECGMMMNDGTGSTSPAAIRTTTFGAPLLESQPLTAPDTAAGALQDGEFIVEDTLPFGQRRYQLLATRELDGLDRMIIEDVLDEISSTGEVEGRNWKLFSAESTGEQIPVIEIELADGAIVQVRPIVPGVELPNPDISAVPTDSLTMSTTSPEETPSSTSESTGGSAAEMTSTKTIATAEPEPTGGGRVE